MGIKVIGLTECDLLHCISGRYHINLQSSSIEFHSFRGSQLESMSLSQVYIIMLLIALAQSQPILKDLKGWCLIFFYIFLFWESNFAFSWQFLFHNSFIVASKTIRQKKDLENVLKNALINKLKRTHAINQIASDDLQFNEAIYDAVMANWMLKNAIR